MKSVLAFACLVLLASCGLQPLHAKRDGFSFSKDEVTQHELDRVFVTRIPNRIGSDLRRMVLEKISPRGTDEEPLYILDIAIAKPVEVKQGIRSDNTATRVAVTYTASYVLRVRDPALFERFKPYVSSEFYNPLMETQELTILLSDSVTATGSYNIVSPYGTIYSENKMTDDLVRTLADNISNHIISFFKSVSVKPA